MNNVESFRASLYALIEHAQHVVITAHLSPDDDSLGSVMALHEILSTKYPTKDIRILYGAEPSMRHASLVYFPHITFVSDIADHLTDTDLLIVLDVNNYNRISKKSEVLATVPVRVIIDHHASTPDESTLSYIDTAQSSNSELVYEIFKDDAVLTTSLAESLLLGILGDTGGLAYVKPSKSETFVVVKKLIEILGVGIDMFRARFGGIPKRITPLLQELVKNTTYISIEGWPDMQYTFISSIEGYSDEELSAASHIYMGQYLPRVEGYGWGVVATPRSDGSTRVSGRSLVGSVNVRQMFEEMQVGGGHDRAAGAHIATPHPEIAIQTLVEWMKSHKPAIV